jgi:hypothetical protein
MTGAPGPVIRPPDPAAAVTAGAGAGADRAGRERVYAAEQSLPLMDRLLAIPDARARELISEHLGEPGYIIRLDGHPARLLAFWHDSPGHGRVPVITAPPGYPLSVCEVAHEVAHLVTDRAGPQLGHGPEFIRNYLHILRHNPRLRDALAQRLQRQGVTAAAAAERRGFFPGDDLSQMPSGGPQVQWVKTGRLWNYREWDHDRQAGTSRNLLTGRSYADTYTPDKWAELIRSLQQDGFREPLKLEYDPASRRAYLGEGNHRVAAARQAGYTAVPLWGLMGHDGERMRRAWRVPGEPALKPEPGHGYFPASFRPADVLPCSYLYQGENQQFCARCNREYPRGTGPEHLAREHPAQWRQAWARYPALAGRYPHLAPDAGALPAMDPAPQPAARSRHEPGRPAARRRAASAATARPGRAGGPR